MKAQRGDIVLVDFPFSSLGVSKIRPALVVQNNLNNQRLINTIVAQITSRVQRLNEATRLLIDPATVDGQGSGLYVPSVIACENLVTVHENLIIRVIGHLTDAVMLKVNECLKASLEIP